MKKIQWGCVSRRRRIVSSAWEFWVKSLIADNGSSDRSVEIAEACGAQVVYVATKGYGAALGAGEFWQTN
ncbi:MAG: hypothetical protein WC426_03980 [Sulfuriferula sp.]